MHAEDAYLFRHALLRDAAYQMQMPGDRAKLHELAFYLIEEAFGGRAPEPPPLDAFNPTKFEPHSTDRVATELAEHARFACASGPAEAASPNLPALHLLYLRRSAEHAQRSFRGDEARRLWQSLAELLEGSNKGEASLRAGQIAFQEGLLSQAEAFYLRGLDEHVQSANREREGVALGCLASVYLETERADLAETTVARSLEIHREHGKRRSEGRDLGVLASVLLRTGRTAESVRAFEQAMSIHREEGNRGLEARDIGNLGTIQMHTNRLEEAERALEVAVSLYREVGDRRGEGIAIAGLASVWLSSGKPQQAYPAYEQALALHREVGNRPSEGRDLGNLASTFAMMGCNVQAERAYLEALEIHAELGNDRSASKVWNNLGALYKDLESVERAFDSALAIDRKLGLVLYEGVHLCHLGIRLIDHQEFARAKETWREGMTKLSQVQSTLQINAANVAMREACAKAGIEPFVIPGEDGEASRSSDE